MDYSDDDASWSSGDERSDDSDGLAGADDELAGGDDDYGEDFLGGADEKNKLPKHPYLVYFALTPSREAAKAKKIVPGTAKVFSYKIKGSSPAPAIRKALNKYYREKKLKAGRYYYAAAAYRYSKKTKSYLKASPYWAIQKVLSAPKEVELSTVTLKVHTKVYVYSKNAKKVAQLEKNLEKMKRRKSKKNK